eukprot:2651809-Rhodomonas_salina.1
MGMQVPGLGCLVGRCEVDPCRDDSDSESEWVCGMCDRTFGSEQALEQHQDDTGHNTSPTRIGSVTCVEKCLHPSKNSIST